MPEVLKSFERLEPEAGHVLRTYAEAARERLADLIPKAPQPILIHGDFTAWNLRYANGELSGILDFDSSHLDLAVADFALSWRGVHDGVISGYEEVRKLDDVERELILPVYWSWVVASAVGGIDQGEVSAEGMEWAISHLTRTPINER